MCQKKHLIILSCLLFWILLTPFATALAKIDLISLNKRENVQATIYKKADLTLIRERRLLQFSEGTNWVQFSWAGTQIDPTSLSLQIDGTPHPVKIIEISYPPDTKDMGIWKIQAESECRVPVDITYFTSGLSWTSFYTVLLSKELSSCTMINQIDITNTSGEDYTDTQTRLVIGRINLLDDIRLLSTREHPYGRPLTADRQVEMDKKSAFKHAARMLEKPSAMPTMAMAADAAPPQIKKQSLSEYFLYTIEGQETFPDRWTKRLESFKADTVKTDHLYCYDRKRYGNKVFRFIRLNNDKDNNLGTTPLPGGKVNVFQENGSNGRLEFIGSDRIQYIPVGKTAELNLGESSNVRILPKTMKFEKKNLRFNPEGNLIGFDEIKTCRTEFHNFTENHIQAEYFKHFDSPDFKTDHISHPGSFNKIDQSTIAFKIKLAPYSKEQVDFRVTIKRGEQRWQK